MQSVKFSLKNMPNHTADIIIIGGGLLGTSVAYHLAREKVGKIILLERMDIASQASSRAACLLTRARTKEVMMHMVQETYDSIQQMENRLGEPLGLQQVGSVTIAASESAELGIKELAMAAGNFNIPFEEVDKKAIKDFFPWITPDNITRAVYMPTDAFIDSAQLCNGYARAARSYGVIIRSRTGVKEIISGSKGVEGVRLNNGELLYAPVVVDAAGAWANLLSHPIGIGLPMSPVRSHFWITDVNPSLFPAEQPFAVIPDARAFTRSDVGGLIIGLREPECVAYDPQTLPISLEDMDFSHDNGWSTLSQCAEGFESFFPGIRDTGIAHYVAGPSCYVPDSMFVAGPVEQIPGFYAATGCCGAGVAAGGGIGRIVAEQIMGVETFVDSSAFNPNRFGQIDPFDVAFRKRCADARSNKKGG